MLFENGVAVALSTVAKRGADDGDLGVARDGEYGDGGAGAGRGDASTPTGDVLMADRTNATSNYSSVNQVGTTRNMFQHLSFLLTTTLNSSAAY